MKPLTSEDITDEVCEKSGILLSGYRQMEFHLAKDIIAASVNAWLEANPEHACGPDLLKSLQRTVKCLNMMRDVTIHVTGATVIEQAEGIQKTMDQINTDIANAKGGAL